MDEGRKEDRSRAGGNERCHAEKGTAFVVRVLCGARGFVAAGTGGGPDFLGGGAGLTFCTLRGAGGVSGCLLGVGI